MFLPDLVVRSRRVVTLRGLQPAAIHLRHGKIIGVLEFDEVLPGSPVDDVAGVVIPAIVDPSVGGIQPEGTRLSEAGTIEELDRLIAAAREQGTRIHLM